MSTSIGKGGDAASLLLRVSLGVMYLTHSIVLKVFTFGFAGTAGYFASLGLACVHGLRRDRGGSHRRRVAAGERRHRLGRARVVAGSRRRILGALR